jgi:hypothetical protein
MKIGSGAGKCAARVEKFYAEGEATDYGRTRVTDQGVRNLKKKEPGRI